MKFAIYETNVSDAQWAIIKPMLPPISKRGGPPTDRRLVEARRVTQRDADGLADFLCERAVG